jgi:Protein kinase domain
VSALGGCAVEELQDGDPRRVGPYRLVRRLGSGGMGRVFLGRSVGGRLVAVKLIRDDLAADPEFRARFGREVVAAKQVGGLFTALVVDADVDGPTPWLATAYVSGPSLADAVSDHGPLPPASVLSLAAGLAEGLGAIHAAGLVHRDLKPSNVLLADDGPRVIDFGISRAAEASALTGTGLVVGSPGFMSPEQAEGHEVGPESDVFSLGAVLVFAATGKPPFGAGTAAAQIYRVVHSQPELDKVPPEVRGLAGRCLAKEPGQRPTPADVLAEVGDAELAADWVPAQVLRGFAGPALGSAVTAGSPAAYVPTEAAAEAEPALSTPHTVTAVPRRRPRDPVAEVAPRPEPGGPPAPRQRAKPAVVLLSLVVALCALCVTAWRGHWPPAVFGRAAPAALAWDAVEAPLPGDAVRTAKQVVLLSDVACSSTRDCTVIGVYTTTRTLNGVALQGTVIETRSGGGWAASAPSLSGGQSQSEPSLLAVTCPGQGPCLGVGAGREPEAGVLAGSTWSPAALPLPAGASHDTQPVLDTVSCPALRNCVAAGSYWNQGSGYQGLVETESGGTWTAATPPLPSDAAPATSVATSPSLYEIACPAADNCIAVGSYTSPGGKTEGLIESLSDRSWTAAVAQLPADAATGSQRAALTAIACPAPGTCVAVGGYLNRNGERQDLIDTLSAGRWTSATAPVPADATTAKNQPGGLSAIACPSVSTCIAAGFYTVRNGTSPGLFDTLSNGRWTAARAPLPPGAAVADQGVALDTIACLTVDNCVAAGFYATQNRADEGLIETTR